MLRHWPWGIVGFVVGAAAMVSIVNVLAPLTEYWYITLPAILAITVLYVLLRRRAVRLPQPLRLNGLQGPPTPVE